MASFNRIVLIGNLTTDPEIRSSMDGTAVAKFQMSVSRPANAGVDFINIIAWRNMAETAGQSLKKGDTALIEGRIQIRTYQDASGQKNWATEVVASSVQPFGAGKLKIAASVPTLDDEVEELPEDDLPF